MATANLHSICYNNKQTVDKQQPSAMYNVQRTTTPAPRVYTAHRALMRDPQASSSKVKGEREGLMTWLMRPIKDKG